MEIIRIDDGRAVPWKNGGGSTTEIAVGPPRALLDTFDWRVSVARIASNGSFSEFPGLDRSIAVVNGRGLSLAVGDAAPVRLRRGSEPFRFRGDALTSAILATAEVSVLNIMTRRAAYTHSLRRIRRPSTINCSGTTAIAILSFNGITAIDFRGETSVLEGNHAAFLTKTDGASLTISPSGACDCYVAGMIPASHDQPS